MALTAPSQNDLHDAVAKIVAVDSSPLAAKDFPTRHSTRRSPRNPVADRSRNPVADVKSLSQSDSVLWLGEVAMRRGLAVDGGELPSRFRHSELSPRSLAKFRPVAGPHPSRRSTGPP